MPSVIDMDKCVIELTQNGIGDPRLHYMSEMRNCAISMAKSRSDRRARGRHFYRSTALPAHAKVRLCCDLSERHHPFGYQMAGRRVIVGWPIKARREGKSVIFAGDRTRLRPRMRPRVAFESIIADANLVSANSEDIAVRRGERGAAMLPARQVDMKERRPRTDAPIYAGRKKFVVASVAACAVDIIGTGDGADAAMLAARQRGTCPRTSAVAPKVVSTLVLSRAVVLLRSIPHAIFGTRAT